MLKLVSAKRLIFSIREHLDQYEGVWDDVKGQQGPDTTTCALVVQNSCLYSLEHALLELFLLPSCLVDEGAQEKEDYDADSDHKPDNSLH